MHILCDFAMFWLNFITLLNQFGLTTNLVHPVASSCFLLFLFFRFSDYLKCPKNSIKIILKISVMEPSGVIKKGKGATTRDQEGPWRDPTLGRARRPPGFLVGPLDAPSFAYIYPSG